MPAGVFARIDYLANQRQAIPQLAAWHLEQWGHLNPDSTVEVRCRSLSAAAAVGSVPTAFVAVEESVPAAREPFRPPVALGSALLVHCDMDSHRELSPWLASVYICPHRRQRGLGSLLVRRVMDEARVLGARRLYLFTDDRAPFYTRLGWQELSRESYHSQEVVVMSTAL